MPLPQELSIVLTEAAEACTTSNSHACFAKLLANENHIITYSDEVKFTKDHQHTPATHEETANTTPVSSSSWPLCSPQIIDDLALALRQGEVARARRRESSHSVSSHKSCNAEAMCGPISSFVAYRPWRAASKLVCARDATSGRGEEHEGSTPTSAASWRVDDELFFSVRAASTGGGAQEAWEPQQVFSENGISSCAKVSHDQAAGCDNRPDSIPMMARRDSSSSFISIQETIFDVRRPSDALWGQAMITTELDTEVTAVIDDRVDLPSERRRLQGHRGFDVQLRLSG